jgi:hypothetical protein
MRMQVRFLTRIIPGSLTLFSSTDEVQGNKISKAMIDNQENYQGQFHR